MNCLRGCAVRSALLLVLSLVGALTGVQSRALAAQDDWASSVAAKADPAVVTVQVFGDNDEETRQASGFIIAADGLVVSNYHVVKDASWALIKLHNGSFLPAIGVVRKSLELTDQDLVILKCEGRGLPILQLGDPSSVRVGQPVAAIGSPMGLEATLSTGVVSATRELQKGLEAIQTTAPVSRGSSGGPLLDADAHVIGVTSAFLSEGQNLNFAVPVCALKEVLRALDEKGKQDVVNLADVPDALAGEGGGGAPEWPAAWDEPSGGLDVFMRLMALQGSSVYAHGQGLPGLGLLGSIHVVVEDLSAAATQSGLSEAYLKSYIELKLHQSSILEVLDDVAPFLYLNLNCRDSWPGWVVYNIRLELNRPALLTVPNGLGDDGKPISAYACVWQRAGIGECRSSDLRGDAAAWLDGCLVEFLNDVRKANPKP